MIILVLVIIIDNDMILKLFLVVLILHYGSACNAYCTKEQGNKLYAIYKKPIFDLTLHYLPLIEVVGPKNQI